MQESDSISLWIDKLKAGDADAARELWDRYYQSVVGLARKRLGGLPRRDADEEDIAQAVFKSVCLGAADGNFPELFDRDDLYSLFIRIVHHKVVDRIRSNNRGKRGGGKTRGDSVLMPGGDDALRGFDQFAGNQPPPDFLAELNEEYSRLLRSLPDESLKDLLAFKLEGRTNEEIAQLLGIATRSVERKLHLIRETLSKHVNT